MDRKALFRLSLIASLLLLLACGRHEPTAAPPHPATTPAPHPAAKPAPLPSGRAAWRAVLGWPDDCEQAFRQTAVEGEGIEVHPLGPARALVEVRCAWGAYQGSYLYYMYDQSSQPPATGPLDFEIRESPDEGSLVPGKATEIEGLPAFDAKTGTLTVLDKFRGPGDCGTLAAYRFDGGRPRLVALRAKAACDGQGAETPERWPEVPLR
ncbi:MAG TPA: DUF1176 domain-containing protein [Thermoanaerobaculia bacterium]